MTENSMFFENGAKYGQDVFARFMKDIISHNGVAHGIDNELEVVANTPANMAVQVKTGRAWFEGYIYENLTTPVNLAIEEADPSQERIDRVVLRLKVAPTVVGEQRGITVAVHKGTPGGGAPAPTWDTTNNVYEISLCQVRVPINTLTIVQAYITDEREYMWYSRANQPLASKEEVGSVKVGGGIDVSGGVISVSYGSYPSLARLYTTDTTYGTLIKENIYNGTYGQMPMGIIFQPQTDTHTVSFTATTIMSAGGHRGDYTTGHVRIIANNVTNGSTRTVLDTEAQTEYAGGQSTHTWTGSVTIALNEIISGNSIIDSMEGSGSMHEPYVSSSDNNVWLGRPI